jgi:predicted HD superfamily hydrolase involved in NAD metabolism
MELDRYRAFVKDVLTPQRFQHSLGVMQVMEQLAPVYDLDVDIARAIGLLHNAAKDLDVEEQRALAHEANLPLRESCETNPLYLHGPVGAYRVAKELGIDDQVILDTISRHSYYGVGAAISPAFCWCMRFADILEPQRSWVELKQQLSPVIYAGDMLEGAYMQLQWNIPFLENRHIPIHPNMQRVYEALCVVRRHPQRPSAFHEIPC